MRFKDYAAKNGGGRTDQMSLPPSEIRVRPGFNPRDPESPEVQAHVRKWADIILSGNWNPSYSFLIRWDGDAPWMLEGHCRQMGIALAATDEFRIEFEKRTGLTPALPVTLVKCDLAPALTNEIDDLYIPLSSQESLPLTPAGWIDQMQKLIKAGQTQAMITTRLGKPKDFVDRMIELAEAPREVREAVAMGAIKKTLATDTLRKHGREKGAQFVAAAIEEGGGRARPRHVREVVERTEKPRTEPPSLCSLATKAILTWDAWIADVEISDVDTALRVAMEAMRERIGMAAMDAAKLREAA